MPKQLLVFGKTTFKIEIPDGARVTFGPWSPPGADPKGYAGASDKALSGTLRIYSGGPKSTENILAVFSGVSGFRDVSLGYAEQVAREEGAVIWKDDEKGYVREDKVTRQKAWVNDAALLKEGDEDEEIPF